jgi:hypothetical protein
MKEKLIVISIVLFVILLIIGLVLLGRHRVALQDNARDLLRLDMLQIWGLQSLVNTRQI